MSEPSRQGVVQQGVGQTGVVQHGSIRLIESKCTSCMICVRECPTWCIHIESHSEADGPAAAGQAGRGRERRHNVLDSFDIDWSLCMYCGICIDECPFDALEWAGAHVAGVDRRADLVHDRTVLAHAGEVPAAQTDVQPPGTPC
ncbi:4Fe-4S binding protein [Propionibacteriaceae bacterium G1746]|uniref:4Fe-4S binding protein n=1 Tax=Aestuariimicrobium sp. G57 TaxID=3418485 RepID=UPI003C23129C